MHRIRLQVVCKCKLIYLYSSQWAHTLSVRKKTKIYLEIVLMQFNSDGERKHTFSMDLLPIELQRAVCESLSLNQFCRYATT
jgi:hypothetical protein